MTTTTKDSLVLFVLHSSIQDSLVFGPIDCCQCPLDLCVTLIHSNNLISYSSCLLVSCTSSCLRWLLSCFPLLILVLFQLRFLFFCVAPQRDFRPARCRCASCTCYQFPGCGKMETDWTDDAETVKLKCGVSHVAHASKPVRRNPFENFRNGAEIALFVRGRLCLRLIGTSKATRACNPL